MQLIKIGKVLKFTQDQSVYNQGQLMTQKESGSGVYVVRRGEFSFLHQSGKEIEVRN